MKYRLKSRDLQAQLDRLSRGDFSRRLDEWNGDRSQELVNFSFGEETGHDSFPSTFETAIRTADIEEVIPFDPTKWNEWPDVEPPEKTLLRIEIITERIGEGTPEPSGGKVRCRGCATYSHGFWMLGEKITVKPRETVRFRPWIDRQDEEVKE